MPSRLIIFIISLAVLFFVYILYSVKVKKLNIKNAIVWIMLDVIAVISTLSIPLMQNIAAFLGIEVVSNMVFFIVILFLMFVTFFITKTISELNSKIITLTQEIALLKEREDRENENQ